MLVPVLIIKKIPFKNKVNTHIWMSLLNVQSIQGKYGAIMEYLLSNNISMAIIMESWLQNNEEDVCRLSTLEFCTGLFQQFHQTGRIERVVESYWFIKNHIKSIWLRKSSLAHFKLPSSRYK